MTLSSIWTRFLRTAAILILAAAIALTRINPDVSSALAAWGATGILSSVALAGLKRKEGRSVEARLLLRFSLILLIAGSVAVSADSAFHMLGYSSMTASLFGLIGVACVILGCGAVVLSFLLPQPGDKKDEYGGLLPAQQSFDGHIMKIQSRRKSLRTSRLFYQM